MGILRSRYGVYEARKKVPKHLEHVVPWVGYSAICRLSVQHYQQTKNAHTRMLRCSALSHPPLVCHRPPIGPHIRTDHPTSRADHARAQGAHRQLVWPVVSVDRQAVMAPPGHAVDQQVATAM